MSLTTAALAYHYVGEELDLFAQASHWKNYFRDWLRPYLGTRVLEVGAGLGATTKVLCTGKEQRWVCLEPDAGLIDRLRGAVEAGELPQVCEPIHGLLSDGVLDETFDTVLYIDVLEHIEQDRQELELAAQRLTPGGRLIVLSPAHNWLYTPFDEALGHYRRYTRRSLAKVAPPNLQLERLVYLDSVGLLASLGNRLILQQALPTAKQIAFWDTKLVTISRRIDGYFAHRIGKTVIGVWRNPNGAP